MEEKRKAPDMQGLARELLSAPLCGDDEELRRELEARGVEPNGAGALLYAQWREALGGDLKAAAFLRDLAGEPEGGTDAAELRTLSDAQLLAMLGESGLGGAR